MTDGVTADGDTDGTGRLVGILMKDYKLSEPFELGSFGYTRAAVASGQAKGGLDYHARANVVGASGRSLYFEERADTSESAGFTAPPSDRMSGYSAFLKLNWKNFRLLGQFSERLKYVPTAPYDTVLNSPNTFFEQKRFFLEARYNRDLSSKLSVMARAYYDGYRLQDLLVTNGEAIEEDTDGDGTPEVAYANPYVFRDFGSADWVGGELQAGLALVQTSKVRDQLYIGLESSHISTRSEAFVATSLTDDTPDESFEPVDIPRSAVAFGTYLQNELEVADAHGGQGQELELDLRDLQVPVEELARLVAREFLQAGGIHQDLECDGPRDHEKHQGSGAPEACLAEIHARVDKQKPRRCGAFLPIAA